MILYPSINFEFLLCLTHWGLENFGSENYPLAKPEDKSGQQPLTRRERQQRVTSMFIEKEKLSRSRV